VDPGIHATAAAIEFGEKVAVLGSGVEPTRQITVSAYRALSPTLLRLTRSTRYRLADQRDPRRPERHMPVKTNISR